MRARLPVEGEPHRGARERHPGIRVEAQRRARNGEFEGAGVLPVADEGVGVGEGAGIHRPARRHADLPQAEPAGQLLKARLGARQQHLDAFGSIGEVAQGRGRDAPACQQVGSGDGAQVVEVGLDAGDGGVGERCPECGQSRRTVGPGDDDLGEHRVVERGDLGAGGDPAVDAGGLGEAHLGQQAGARREIRVRDLRVEPGLDRRAPRHEWPGRRDRILARGLAHHPFHEVDAEHRLRHRMLHLEPRVHFEEREVLAVRIVDELDGAGRGVGDALPQRHRRGMEPGAHGVGEAGGRRLLDHLLVPALERAVAFAERDDAAPPVAEDLHLDMAGLRHEALEIDAGIAEAGPRGALDRGEALGQLLARMAELHPDAAAARRALEHHRIADRLGRIQRRLDIRQQAGAGQERDAAGFGQLAGRVFEAEGAQVLRARTDENDPFRRQPLGEADILGQEAVAGMDGLGAGHLTGGDDGLDLEIALRGRRGPEAHGLVGGEHARREAVGVGVDGDRGDTHAPQCAHDAGGDLAAIGDQNLGEHALKPRRGRSRGSAWG